MLWFVSLKQYLRPFRDGGDFPWCHPDCQLPGLSGSYNGQSRFWLLYSPEKPPSWGNRRVRSVALRCAFWYCTCATSSLADDLLLLFWPLVDPARFELATFSMPLRRAPNCAMGPDYLFLSIHCSGPGGIRTLDLFSAIEARSQLRYRPSLRVNKFYPSQL
jgi:hypothetical protein